VALAQQPQDPVDVFLSNLSSEQVQHRSFQIIGQPGTSRQYWPDPALAKSLTDRVNEPAKRGRAIGSAHTTASRPFDAGVEQDRAYIPPRRDIDVEFEQVTDRGAARARQSGQTKPDSGTATHRIVVVALTAQP
jgi:hypothetical protein